MTALNVNLKILISGVLLMLLTFCYAESPDVRFKRITINDGLSLSSVYCIHQDARGFMWFGTEDGLNKYDGKRFTIYNHKPGEKNSLSNKWVESILEDKHGNIWVGSKYGLTQVDPTTNIMTRFMSSNHNKHSLSNDTIITMLENGDFIWIGTKNGVNRIHTGTMISESIPFNSNVNVCVNVLSKDNSGRTWVGTNIGMHVSIPNTDKIINLKLNSTLENDHNINAILAENDTLLIGSNSFLYKIILNNTDIESKYQPIIFKTENPIDNIMRDSQGRLWIQTSAGLHQYASNKLELIIEGGNPSPSLAINPKIPLIEDNFGNIWYGTFGRGLFKIMAKDDQIIHYLHDPTNNNSISEDDINCLFADKTGGIWIGTFGAGISIYDPTANLIKTLKNNPFNQKGLSSNFVWSIQEDFDKNIWIGTNNTGINIYKPKERTFSFLTHDPLKSNSLPPGGVREIFCDQSGTIWVGTDGGGLSKYNPQDKSFTTFTNDPTNNNSISDNSVRTIFQDTTGILWIGTRNGLNKFNPKTKQFKQFLNTPDNPKSISNNFIYSAIYMDKKGFLWIGTYGGGLNKLNTQTEEFEHYKFDENNISSLSDDVVFSIYEDEKGYFWIGTNSGLNLFNPATGKFKRYGTEVGLPNEVIYGIVPDNNNHLWLTTNKGISRLDLTEFRFKNFDVNDGLQSNEFNGGAFAKGSNGFIYAGGVYGLNIIDPARIVTEENHAQIIISRLEILGKDVLVMHQHMFQDTTESSDKLIELVDNYYLPKHVTYVDVIKLNYKQRFFSIEFAALNHLNPDKLNYRYRMKNLEDHWNYTGNRNYVTYANMKPGSYYFEVDAMNSDGVLADHPAHLKISIAPPFWRSYWFVLMEVILALTLIIFFYRFLLNQRTNKILKDQYEAIKIAHHKLQLSENDLKELNATKDKFFSIISHDLKNPFASVLSISELLKENFDQTEKEDLKYGVNKIYATNKHIYELLENLLTWSKSQRGKIDVNKCSFNLSNIIDTNINILKLSAEKKHIEIKKKYPDNLSAFGDREMISSVIRNLLNNAVKFTPEGKSISVLATPDNQFLTIKVKDEGVGISEENQQKLFKIEDKFKSNGTAGEKGTGLGLIISKEFIEKNGGEISLTSEPEKGSTFTFTVPCRN